MWKGAHHRDPGCCPFSSFARATKPSLSSHNSSLLCFPSARAQDELLQTRLCMLVLLEDICVCSRLCLSLADIIPADFQCQIICEHLFSAVVLWAGKPGLGLTPHAPQGQLCSWDIPPESQPGLWEWGQPFLGFCPSYHSECGFFCKSLVIRLLFR